MAFDLASAQPVKGFDLSSAQLTTPNPKDYDPTPKGGAPEGFHEIRTNGAPYIVHDNPTIDDAIRALKSLPGVLSDLPGVGMAERIGQGATRLAGKAVSGLAGLVGGPDTVQKVQGAVNRATELPPSNDPLVQATDALGRGASAVASPVDRAVGNLPAGARTAIEATEEAAPDIASVLGLRTAAPAEAATTNIARSPIEVAKAAGYTGLRTKADLKAPGNQAITDALISKDAGVVPGQIPSVTALENGRRVGPGKVYAQAEAAIPEKLTQDPELQVDLGNLPKQVSQLPRSPDIDALQETMLAKPDFTRDELFANIREARERAKAHWKSDDPDKGALGDAYHSLANAYEDFAGRQLEQANAGVTLPDWLAARTQMAKNYQAQGALRGEHFDPQVYGKIAERNPHLLTGNSAIVGHVANGLPSSGTVGMADIAPAAGGALAGEALGQHMGVPGVGAVTGAVAAPMVRAKLQQLLTRGQPDLAAQTGNNPALSYFFNQGRMPPGWNRSPVTPQIAGLLPSPSMVNAGGGASTPNTLENLGLTPDVQAAGAQHPAAAKLAALREQLSQPPERPAEPVDFQGPQKWGNFSVAPSGAPSPQAGGVPFADVLEQGGTQGKPVAGVKSGYRPAPQSPKGPNMRTPEGAPTLTDAVPTGPSDAQIAFRNQQAAARLRKVAGDLSVDGPGGSTGSPLDRLRAALLRRERGYAEGGQVIDFAKRGADTLMQRIQEAFHNPYTADWGQLKQDISKYWTTTAPPLAQAATEATPPVSIAAPKEDSLDDITRQLHALLGSNPAQYAGGGRVELAQKLEEFIERITQQKAAEDAASGARFPDRPRPPLVQSAEDPLTSAALAPPADIAAPPAAPSPAGVFQPGWMFKRQALADGGSVDDPQSSIRRLADAARALDNPSGTDSNAENRARAATNLASLVYGLDAQGQPALGGRAWTSTQGGTPAGALDALTATPHALIQLASTVDKYLPGKSNPQFWSSVDPQWSQDAAQRLSQLRQRLQQTAGVAPAKSLSDNVIDLATDPAMLAPLGAAKIAGAGAPLGRALNWGAGGTEDSTHAAQGAR